MGSVHGERKLNTPAAKAKKIKTSIPDCGRMGLDWNGFELRVGGEEEEDGAGLEDKSSPTNGGWFNPVDGAAGVTEASVLPVFRMSTSTELVPPWVGWIKESPRKKVVTQ